MNAPARLRPRRLPVQRRSLETVEAILVAAAQVFERHGYARGTTNRIARRAGVSIGTLYQYFPNKDAILVALTERHLQEGTRVLGPMLGELAQSPPRVRVALERISDALLELHRHQPNLHRVLFEEAPRPAALERRLDRAFDRACEALARYLAAQPDVAVADVSVAAQLVVQVLEAVTHRLAIHPRAGIPPERYAAEAVTMLERHLTR
jgi:AcrR family transcriptional regulator